MQTNRLFILLNPIQAPFHSRLVAEKLKISCAESSLSLMRLHRSGFLSRKSAVRICVGRDGRKVRRGHEYLYSFTKKGRDHLYWLQKVKPLRDSMSESLLINIMAKLDKPDQNLFMDKTMPELLRRYQGPGKRHPVERLALILCDMLSSKIDRLSSKTRELESELEAATAVNIYLIRQLRKKR